MKQQLKVAIPLAAATLLSAAFAILLVDQMRRSEPEAPPNGSPLASPAASLLPDGKNGLDLELPQGDPSAPDPWKPRETKRHPGRFSRWNLGDVPEGWDPELARRLHNLFDRIEFRHLDSSETHVRVGESMEELKELLAGLGPEALPTLGKILDVEPDFVARRRVLEAVGRLGRESNEATWILRDYYYARYDDPRNRSEIGHVIQAMGELQNDTSFDQLRYLAENDTHRMYREKFIVELGNHPRRAEAVDVFDWGMTDPDFQTRNKSAQALGKVASEDTLDSLVRAYGEEPIWYAKQTILGSIGKVGSPDAIPFLEEQARTADESGVRLSAASAIRRIVEKTGDRYGRQVLDELSRSEPDLKVRGLIEGWATSLASQG